MIRDQRYLTGLMALMLCVFMSFIFVMVNSQFSGPKKSTDSHFSTSVIDSAHLNVEVDLESNLKLKDDMNKKEFRTQDMINRSKTNNNNQSFTPQKEIKLPIIMYHHIDTLDKVNLKDLTAVGLRVGPDIFERQLKYIIKEGYTTITSYDLAQYINGTKQLPSQPILLTFDDGYKDNYTNALPLLEKYKLKGDFGIITSATDRADYMSTEDIKDIVKKGHSLASHTVSHCTTAIKITNNSFEDSPVAAEHDKGCTGFAIQEKLTTGQIQFEFEKSKADLESKYGVKVNHLIYPFGFWNKQAVSIAKEAGYTFATTVSPEVDETIDIDRAFTLPRYRANGQQEGELKGFFAGGR